MRYFALLEWLTYLSVLLGVGSVALVEGSAAYFAMTLVACGLTWTGERARARRSRRRASGDGGASRPPAAAGGDRPSQAGGKPEARRGEHPVPWPGRAFLGAGLLGYAVADTALFGTNAILTLAHLLNFAVVLKLTAKKGPRDYLQVYVMALFSLVVGGYFSADVLFSLFLLAFVVTAGWGMMLLAMGGPAQVWVKSGASDYAPRTLNRQRLPGWDEAIGVRRSAFLVRTAGSMVAIFVPAVVLFLLAPRSGAVRVRLPQAGRYYSVTGFSERVQLGEIADILTNPAVVMRVQLSDPVTDLPFREPDVPLLWRGITLDEYRRQRTWGWRKTAQEQNRYREGVLLGATDQGDEGRLVVQQVVLEPIDSGLLFALAPVVRLVAIRLGEIRVYSDDLSLQLVDPPGGLRQYEVLSARSRIAARGPAPDERHLAVPAEIEGDLRRLAEAIAPDAHCPTPADKVEAMMRHLQPPRFAYALAYQGTRGAEPVTDFLTTTRKGHCELFASALALLLRTRGVPTRLVNGFRGGEWNEMGDFLVVRQEDAHSWVEVYLDGLGWCPFDPTPAAGPGRSGRGPLKFLREWYDYLKWSWLRNVVRYDRFRQRRVMRALGDVLALDGTLRAWNRRTLRVAWRQWEQVVRRAAAGVGLPALSGGWLTASAVTLAALAVAVPILLVARRWRRRRDRQIAPVAFYQALLLVLARLGFTRGRAQTPMEFAARVAAERPDHLDIVPWITQQYYRVRYGGEALPPPIRQRIREALERLAAPAARPKRR